MHSALRAASVSAANPRKTFLVEGVPAKLRVEYSLSEKSLFFSVWEKDRRMKSSALDGFEFIVETIAEPVPVQGKGARVSVPESSVEFVLRDTAGKFLKLVPEA